MAFIVLNGNSSTPRTTIQVRWLRPPISWFKLNSDRSSLGNLGIAGGGGLIRNDRGNWIKGYARSIGITAGVAVELWALRDGIKLCLSLNLQAVEVELDAKLVVDLLGKEGGSVNVNNTIVADYKEGLRRIPRVKIKHCYHEANKCADALARRGALMNCDFVIFSEPPSDIDLLLRLYADGTMYDCSISSVSFLSLYSV
nr:putative ribonuclease h protein [Quercus suber]